MKILGIAVSDDAMSRQFKCIFTALGVTGGRRFYIGGDQCCGQFDEQLSFLHRSTYTGHPSFEFRANENLALLALTLQLGQFYLRR
jgi:hypothetical protein